MNDSLVHSVAIDQLCIGMYVLIPGTWLNHSFLRNKFLIKNDSDLRSIKKLGLENIRVDFSKSRLPEDFKTAPEKTVPCEGDEVSATSESALSKSLEVPDNWDTSKLIPEQLLDALSDHRMPPEQRSQVIYHHSREVMKGLLENPTIENIQASKAVIGDISECILADDQTAKNMLRITSHDFYTYTHSVNVGVTSLVLAKELFKNTDAHNLRELGVGFFLHDLGKVKVKAGVINKAGPLSKEEMKHMRIHPYQGRKLLDLAGGMSEECRCILMQHHERVDGTGYPQRLKGDEIHLYARICCIADVFDALTAERSYKKAMTTFEALTLMKNQMSDHFDRAMFNTFVRMYSRG